MGEIIMRKVRGMNWMAKISLVLIFTLLFSTFMYQGWYKPKSVQAATPTRVQQPTGSTGNAAATTFNVTVAAPVDGNTMVAVISTRGTTANRVSSITQTGATWSRVTQATNAGGTTTEIWYAPNVVGAGTTVTVNLAASLFAAAVVTEYSGLLTPTSTDQVANATGNSTAASTGTTAATTQAAELWFGGVGLVSSGYTLGTITNGFTAVANASSTSFTQTNNARVYALEKIVAATATAFSGGTVSTSSQWSGAIATFKASPAVISTYYMWEDNTTNLGAADGLCNLPAGSPSTFTGYPAKTTLGTAEQGITSYRYYPAGMVNGSTNVVERLYAPVYAATAMNISGISASMAWRAANATDSVSINLYDYDPNGAAGNKTLIASQSTPGKTGTVGTTTTATWTPADFTIVGTGLVPLNHRLLVETSYYMGGATTGVRFYCGAAGALTSTNFTVTETPVVGTTLGTGVDATTGAVCPGSTQKLGGFSFMTDSGTDSVTALTVTTTGQAGIASLQIWDEAGTTQYFTTKANAASDTWTFNTGTAIPVTTTPTNYKIVAIYDSQATAPAGNTATTGYVSAYTVTKAKSGADTAEATLTLDNTASSAAVWGANTGGTTITLNWTNGDGGNALIVRYTANTDTTMPTEGTTYTVGAGYGVGGTVIYEGTGTTTTDNPAAGTYYYKIFAHDTCNNYAATAPWTAALARTNGTTLGTGVDATTGTVCPGTTQKLGGFSFSTTSGTDNVTALTVTTTGQAGIASLQIWDEAGTTQYFTTKANAASDTWTFNTGTAIPVTTTPTNYKIVAIYDSQAASPAGNTATTGYVSAYTCTNAKIGADTAEATLTLDNTASSAATWGTNTAGTTITLNWTNGSGGNALIVRYTANTDTTMPTEGTTYTVGAGYGVGGTVIYEGVGTTTTDNPAPGTYYYKIFAHDTCGNYATTAPWTAALTKTNTTTLGTGVDATAATVCPGSSQKLGGFSFKTGTGTDSVTALTVTTTGQAGIASLQIWNEAGTTQYFTTKVNAASDTWIFNTGTAIPVTTTQANYKIVAIYDSQTLAPVGNTATTGLVSAYTCTLAKIGADTAEATLTLDNTASSAAVWGTNIGGGLITLNWTNGDGGNALVVRYTANTDTTMPTEGTTYTVGAGYGVGGTVVYDGTGTTMTDGPANGTYYYRIFAHDGCSNYAVTAPWTAALTKTNFPSTITSCAGCHGYTGAFNDGTARNNPPGTFVGSHNTHVVTYSKVCSVCHVVPATETSADFGHRTGNIQMASPINGDTGGAYGKGTSWAQTNSPTAMQACSNVYCHSQGTSKTANTGETRTTTLSAPLTALNWGDSGVCSSCHGYPPSYANGDTTWGAAKANSHSKHQTQCSTCHNATTADSVTITNTANHTNKLYNLAQGNGATFAYTYAAAGGTCTSISCHNPGTGADASRQWGGTLPGATYKCVTCHTVSYPITVGPAKGGTRSIITGTSGEFGLTWGHRNAARTAANGAVTDADCIVCHLEGDYATQSWSSKHGDGYIDLRDPDGTGETPITDMSGNPFRFPQFSTSASRTSTGHLSNNVDNVLTQKFCLACHDSDGAKNPTARSNNGGTGTAAMPFGGIALGATYTAANNAIGTQGLVDVKTQFATTNSSYHPVLGPLNRDLPNANSATARLAAPYDNQDAGRVDAGGTKTLSVVLTCFDCHNASAAPLTTRTVVAHGNAETLRGTIYASNAASTLCTTCHLNYTVTSGYHGAGSAWAATGQSHNARQNCHYCHGSNTGTTRPNRPLGAQDYHGNNALVGGGLWPTVNSRPYAFIRGWSGTAYHRPFRATEFSTGSATCGAGTCPGGGQVGDGTTRTYTPGGSY